MWITIPAAADGAPAIRSVLDLDPLLAYARECRPDAVSLPVPLGADDLPNGAALAAIRERLEEDGLRVVPAPWRVPAGAPVEDAGWEAEELFSLKALLAALYEAGVGPLVLLWEPPAREPAARGRLERFAAALLEEAERGEVSLALEAALPAREMAQLLRRLDSPRLGACLEARALRAPAAERLGERLLAVRAVLDAPRGAEDAAFWQPRLRLLGGAAFPGPLLLEVPEEATEPRGEAQKPPGAPAWRAVRCAYAVGLVRGLLTRD